MFFKNIDDNLITISLLVKVKDEESQTEEIVKSIQTTSGLAQKARETYSQRCQVDILRITEIL